MLKKFKFCKILLLILIILFINIIFHSYNLSSSINTKSQKIQSNNILCVIFTTKKNFLSRAEVVWDTWAHKCNKSLFATNLNDLNSNSNEKTLKLIEKLEILNLNSIESYDKMSLKAMLTLKSLHELYSTKFKWFLLADDDTFIFVNNLIKFISNLDYNEALIYGHNVKPSMGYHGGAGILLPIESLKRIFSSIITNRCNFVNGYGDIAISECAFKSKVKIGNSLDSKGRERFHPLDPHAYFFKRFPPSMKDFSSNQEKFGLDCCSDETISFHYVRPDDMRFIHFMSQFN